MFTRFFLAVLILSVSLAFEAQAILAPDAPQVSEATPRFTLYEPHGPWHFPIPYYISPGTHNRMMETALLRAADKWNLALGGNRISVVKSKKIISSWNGKTGINLVYMDTGWISSTAEYTLAMTTTNSTVQMFYITVNGQFSWHEGNPFWVKGTKNYARKAQPYVKAKVDLDRVMLHEFGHILGLGHSADPNSTMYPYLHESEDVLGADDIAGIKSIYGE